MPTFTRAISSSLDMAPPQIAASAELGPERALLERVALGDSAALRALYERCSGRAFSIALRILRSRHEAEEVLQETFLHVWRRAKDYDAVRGGPEAWIVTIARSRAIDRLRSAGVAARAVENKDDFAPTAANPMPIEMAEQRQSRELVEIALKELPPEQRAVVELAYFEGLTQREIADRTGDPLGTVKTRVRLALFKLASVLKGEGLEDAR